jgi:hypothetical protein
MEAKREAVAIRKVAELTSLTIIEPTAFPLLHQTGDLALYEEVATMHAAYVRAFKAGDKGAARRVIDFFGGKGTFDALTYAHLLVLCMSPGSGTSETSRRDPGQALSGYPPPPVSMSLTGSPFSNGAIGQRDHRSDPRGSSSGAGTQNSSLFDHLVGTAEQRNGKGDAERLGGFQVDDQCHSRLHHREVLWLLALRTRPVWRPAWRYASARPRVASRQGNDLIGPAVE